MIPTSEPMHLHSNLKHLRTLKGRTCAEVSNVMELPRSTLSGWENGYNEPNCGQLLAISDYYRLSIDSLLLRALSTMPIYRIEETQREYI